MRGRVALPILLLVLALPGPASAVSDDALLYLRPLETDLRGQGENGSLVEIAVWAVATDDAPDGELRGTVEFDISHYNGTGPHERFVRDLAAQRPAPSHPQSARASVNWTAQPGLYLIWANLTGPDGSLWDQAYGTTVVGSSPSLRSGWGYVSVTASAFDVDEDGALDLRLADPSGTPVVCDLQASTYTGIDPWDHVYIRQLAVSFVGCDAESTTTVTVAEAPVRSLLGLAAAQPLAVLGKDLADEPVLDQATYTFRFAADAAAHYLYPEVFFRYSKDLSPSASLAPGRWADGFRTHINLTYWDLDEDGAQDLRFWNSTAPDLAEARNQTEAERAREPIVMFAKAAIEHRVTRRVLSFSFERGDHRPTGAWIAVSDAHEVLRRVLDENATRSNTTLRFDLSEIRGGSFVEVRGSVTWVWVGHFSAQTVNVVLEYTPTTTTTTSTRPSGAPFVGPATLILATLVALLLRRPTTR